MVSTHHNFLDTFGCANDFYTKFSVGATYLYIVLTKTVPEIGKSGVYSYCGGGNWFRILSGTIKRLPGYA